MKEAPQKQVKTVAQVSEALSTCQAGQECKGVLKAGLKVYIRNSSTLVFLPPVPANRQVFLSSHIKMGDFLSVG